MPQSRPKQRLAGDGSELYSLILRAETDRLHLAHPRPDGITAETIPFERRPNYFGSRPYFLCPGNSASPEAGCGRRVLKLYLMHSQFRCRYCHQLVYASPYERPWERAFRRANMLRQQIDSNAGLDVCLSCWLPIGCVGDNGRGWTPEAFRRLFQSFSGFSRMTQPARDIWSICAGQTVSPVRNA